MPVPTLATRSASARAAPSTLKHNLTMIIHSPISFVLVQVAPRLTRVYPEAFIDLTLQFDEVQPNVRGHGYERRMALV